MKIVDKIRRADDESRCFWSFEYFPPKTEVGIANLYDRMERMYNLGPEFIDVTWNAGGNSSDLSLQICSVAQSVYGLETCLHLTCTNMPRHMIDDALSQAKEAGIQNILALRGDPPRGQENWTKVDTGFSYAADLVKYIRKQYGNFFCIGVAGYPEGHIDNAQPWREVEFLKLKVDAGADYIVTQLFYDANIFIKWLKEIRAAGVIVPVLPGIMPIQNFSGFKRMTTLCKTAVPQFILDDLDPIKDDDQAVKEYGVRLAIDMCSQMINAGQTGFHFYTLNLEKSTRLILEGLEFVAPIELVKPLPWNPSLAKNRSKENVRPIFWSNRKRSYVMRTESWDDFPNGRWGDSRSPAFGNIDCHGISLKLPREDCISLWGTPETKREICRLFERYCLNDCSVLPWCESSLCSESEVIRTRLASVNNKGFLTINSQPAVDGASSEDRVFGWGPKSGYVYQKAYLEFFLSEDMLEKVLSTIQNIPQLSFCATNRSGEFRTNMPKDSPNAVTWGVFPCQEILQPTIVEFYSFMAWKDEAFELWKAWADLYDPASPSRQLLSQINDSWWLMNIVDNNHKLHNRIFDILEGIDAGVGV